MDDNVRLEKLSANFFGVLDNKDISDEVKLKKIKYIASLGGNVNIKDLNSNSLLHYAVKKTGVKVVSWLLDFGVDKNGLNKYDETPLIVATKYNNREVVDLLCNKRVRLEKCDLSGRTALMAASANGYEDIVKILIKSGANLDTLSYEKFDPAISYAVQNKHYGVMKILIENGADVNIDNQETITPLARSVDGRDVEAAKLLIDAGADINFKDDLIETVLYDAIRNKDLEMVELLLDNGANIEAKTRKDITPLMVAYETGDEWIVKELEKRGANRKQRTITDEDMLMFAIKGKNVELIRHAIKLGDDVNRRTFYYNSTPLLVACLTGDENVVEELISRGARIERKVWEDKRVLEVMVSRKSYDVNKYSKVVKCLVKNGAKVYQSDINSAFNEGYSDDVIECLKEANKKQDDKSYFAKFKEWGKF